MESSEARGTSSASSLGSGKSMRLDFAAKSGNFLLYVPRIDAPQIMREHGLDHSLPASTPTEACLFTPEPFAAVSFVGVATDSARSRLAAIAQEISNSWASEPASVGYPRWLCPPDREPYPLQLADLEYIGARQHALDADEPGIGKTPTAIMWGNLLAHDAGPRFKALVICPASIKLQWADQIRKWNTHDALISVATDSSCGVPCDDDGLHWSIVSYDVARNRNIHAALLKNHYNLLVLDEAHYLKNATAARTRHILGAEDRGSCIADRAEHILALTGTPIPNRPREAYRLARSLCHSAVDWMSERAFNERFNPRALGRTAGGKRYNQEGVGRHHELQARLRACFMVRHLKRDAMPQLKLPVFDLVYADETAPVRAALQAERLLDIDPDAFAEYGAGRPNWGEEEFGAIATARKMMGLALAPQVAAYVKMLHECGTDKIALFAWHVEVLDFFQKELDRLGVVRVDGRTTEAGKARAVVRFQTNPRCGVILGNVLSLGTGTDGLQTVCGHCVVAEADWVMGNNIQVVDRLDRVGQTRTVLADFFVARGSLAERVLATALRKGAIVHKSLDGKV